MDHRCTRSVYGLCTIVERDRPRQVVHLRPRAGRHVAHRVFRSSPTTPVIDPLWVVVVDPTFSSSHTHREIRRRERGLRALAGVTIERALAIAERRVLAPGCLDGSRREQRVSTGYGHQSDTTEHETHHTSGVAQPTGWR